MIVFRRFIAVLLGLLFIILFIVLLVVNRVNSTAGNSGFYVSQLRRADIYNFLYHDILPAALDEIKIKNSSDFPFDIEEIKAKIPGTLEQAVPPEWLQAQVEQVITKVEPYVLGSTNSFTVDIPLKDRVEAVAGAVKDLLHDDKFFTDMYDQGIQFGVDQYQKMEDLPSFLQMSDNDVASMIRSVLPADWIQSQVDTNIDAILPYITKDSENFTLRIDVSGRMDALESAATDILMKPAAYNSMFNELVVKYIQNNTEAIMTLPVGISFTQSEITDVAQQAFTLDWYRTQVASIVSQVFSYLRGSRNTIDIVIPAADVKSNIINVLTAKADLKLEAMVNALPVATPAQEAELLANPPQGSLPPYRTATMSYTDFKALLDINVASLTASFVDTWLPDQITFNDADIRQSLSSDDGKDLLAQARDFVRDGITYTDADLRQDMNADDLKTIDDARQYITTDYTFTEADLQKWATESKDVNSQDTWQSFQDVRPVIGTVRTWLWAAWLVPALLLVGIAYLGGRGWKSRVVWVASVLAIASLLVFIAAGPVFSAVAKPQIDDAIVKAVGPQNTGVATIAADKGISIAENTVNSFVGGINIEGIVIFVVCLVVIAVVVWHPWSRGSRSA